MINFQSLITFSDEMQKIAAHKQHSDKQHPASMGARVGAGIGSVVGTDLAIGGLGLAAMHGLKSPAEQVDPEVIRRQMHVGNTGTVHHTHGGGPAMLPRGFVDSNSHIVIPKGMSGEAGVAHELGHIKNHNFMHSLGRKAHLRPSRISRSGVLSAGTGSLSAKVSPIAGIVAATQKTPTWTPGLTSLGLAAPRLIDEAAASTHAVSHLIRQHGLARGLRKAVPLAPAYGTYATLAGAPLAITAYRKHLAKKRALKNHK